MRIVLSGASGLVGRALVPALLAAGHSVTQLVRSASTPSADGTGVQRAAWDPARGQLDAAVLDGADAVICLSGASIADGRWTARRKRLLLASRVDTVRTLAETMTTLADPPETFLTASAIGVYGDQGDRELTEDAQPGEGFLADVCQRWEAAAAAAREVGVRTVHLRFGMVLAKDGGALGKMLTPFKLGLGGPLGSGSQWMSWITLGDLVAAVLHCLTTPSLTGGINLVTPEPVRNREFTATLGRVLRRPAVLPAPAVGLRLALGEMADELLLASQRVLPKRLEDSGFRFRWPLLEPALRAVLAGEASGASEGAGEASGGGRDA